MTVFWEPRIGRYFDQIVLSGISPLRFVIGKATSQNLFLGLVAFLLLPYLVLSLMLGGVNLSFFTAGLFLVWLYCMTLALVTLSVSLYLNELLAAILVITVSAIVSVLGTVPMPAQPFVMTPFPAIVHPLHASIHISDNFPNTTFFSVFASCAGFMAAMSCLSLVAIYLGPLYGIIRENSTFGEVVRSGDNKRKRWFRIRMHIQRSSEIAFFYENRSRSFLRHEGLFRWGIGFGGLLLLIAAAHFALFSITFKYLMSSNPWWVLSFHSLYLTIHAIGLTIGVILFSHAKNTTYLQLQFVSGRMVEVSKLDTRAFLLWALISTLASIAAPFQLEQYINGPGGTSIFPNRVDVYGTLRQVDFVRVALEGSLVISVVGLVVYALQRLACLLTWMRSVSFAAVAALYLVFICELPILSGTLFLEIPELRCIPILAAWAPILASVSPFMVLNALLMGEMGSPFLSEISMVPFYIVHSLILILTILGIRRCGRNLRQMYLAMPVPEASNNLVTLQ